MRARAEMVSTSRSLSWLRTVHLGPETDSLSSGLSWMFPTSTSEASPSCLVPQHQGDATKTLWKLPKRLAVASRKKKKKQQPVLEPVWDQRRARLASPNPHESSVVMVTV